MVGVNSGGTGLEEAENREKESGSSLQKTTNRPQKTTNKSWHHSAAGACAGMGTTVLLHPFDIIRTRMQVHDTPKVPIAGGLQPLKPGLPPSIQPTSLLVPQYRGTVDALFTIARTEGLRGVYAGLVPSLLGSTVSWGLYFLLYDQAKQRYAALARVIPAVHPPSPRLHDDGEHAGAGQHRRKDPRGQEPQEQGLQVQSTRPRGFTEPGQAVGGEEQGRTSPVQPLSSITGSREEADSSLARGDQQPLGDKVEGDHSLEPRERKLPPAQPRGGEAGEARQVARERGLSPWQHLAAATEAGVITTLLTNPIWVVKTRMQLQVHPSGTPHDSSAPLGARHVARPHYTGFTDALKSIVREEGWAGLYKGIGPAIVLISHGSIQFLAYEELKVLAQEQHKQDDLTPLHYLVLGGASKLCAVLLTYPYQVLKTRMQMRPPPGSKESKYRTSLQAVRMILRNEGIMGFYKGMGPNLLRVLPSSSLTFFIYELTLKMLKQA